ncbi:MAG: NBR1-Ig-like domain-containing protein [Anaerolineales bacterium]|nr:NBR1-Ig-like domain-containing protein [Anaerolineales bacterium]
MRSKIWMSIIIFSLLLASCNMPVVAESPAAPGMDAVGTSVELTTVARMTELAGSAAPLPATLPAVVPPTLMPILTPTNTPVSIPCNKASFVTDVNYPDGTKLDADANFTKTWRLKNDGSCTWTSGYSVIFDHGDRMGTPDWAQLTIGTVAPGGTVDVSVNLKAPASAGTYQGFFKLKAADSPTFGINANGQDAFWVKVAVKEQAVLAGVPDLVAYAYQYAPKPAIKDQPADVMVTVRNDGTAPAGQFTVVWLSNQTTPGCDWTVQGLGIDKSKNLECQFTFTNLSTQYASFIVDSGNQVVESNEGNNKREWEWKVNP